MVLRKDDFFVDCLGAVTIVTVDRIVFQGQIRQDDCDRHHQDSPPEINVYVENEVEFILLELRCDPALIRDNANIEEIEPSLFEEGDVIRINLADIVAIGPSNGCLDDTTAAKGDV
jgi:hypothetical protein